MQSHSPVLKFKLVAATLISGLLWYFAINISGKYGFLLWIAPLPVLWISLQSTARTAFASAFLAYLLGRLSWIPFLIVLIPLIPLILVTVLPPVFFGLYIWLNRWIVLKSQSAWSVFAFPAIVTSFEFLIFNNQVDGTAGSLAYTQSNYLAVIQIASVTGIWGIIFIVSLLPSAIITIWHFREKQKKQIVIASVAGIILISTFLFGMVRFKQVRLQSEVMVGITAVAEDLYTDISKPARTRERIVDQYKQQISSLAKQGARYVLFPEKIFDVRESQKDSLISVFQTTAAQLNTTIIGGIAVRKEKTRLNLVEFIPPSGGAQEYQKRFHVKNFEADFERGNKVCILKDTPFASGMAICKDLDFPAWLRKYQNADILFVPAWDFVQDGWLHSRMAVLRGVENGYTIVRAGRQGRLTVSDYRGKVVAEVNAENGKEASLLAKASIYHVETIYSKWGDWFGWLSVCFMLSLTVLAWVVDRFRKQLH